MGRLLFDAWMRSSFRFNGFFSAALFLGSLVPVFSQQVTASAHGVQAVDQGMTMQVTALREDVLRVRIWRGGTKPEDASWAVLPKARTSAVDVSATASGFHTQKLRVEIGAGLKLTVSDLDGHVLQEDASPIAWRGDGFRLYKKRAMDEHFFGLGDKPGPLDRGGQAFTMWNTDNFGWQESTDPIYKSIPFFIDFREGRAFGVLFDNTWRSFFDFGREDEHAYSFGAPNGPIDYYLMYGPEPKEVVSTYAWLTGPTPLPPLWALGFQQSRYSYYPEAEFMAIASRLRADKIPSDALYLDIDYQKNNIPFTVDPEKFPKFPEMVKELAKDKFHLVVITDLHIAKQAGVGYKPYDTGVAGDHFVKNPDGSTFVGPVWPGPSVFPDFTRAQTRKWWGTLYKEFASEGVAGFWNDMNEPAVFETPTKTMPDNIQHRIDEPGFVKRTTSHLEIHNVFGMENSRGTYEGLLALEPNVRPFVLTRASYAGGQRYASTWTGDNSSTWNHLRQTVPQIVNLGLSGFSMTGADVGGFAGSPSPELLTKWIEYAAFQPIDRDHAAKGTRAHEVWADGPEQEAIRKRYIEERYKLMPYLYTAAEETSRDGIPIMRPLFLEFPHATSDGHPMDLDTGGGEFLFGGRMLVAANPSPEEVNPYEVHLPPGTWFDYWTGERFERATKGQRLDLEQRDKLTQDKPLMITPKLDTLPVYVRGGSILPIAPLTQSTEEAPNGPLTLRIYLSSDASEPCAGEVYSDDGKSFAYRKGQFARVRFTCKIRPDGSMAVDAAQQEGSYTPWWKTYRIEVYGWTPKDRKVEVEGKVLELTQSGVAWAVEVGAERNGVSVALR
ncbi:Alpha-glucosidase [Granulicella sibirica]|uniref:Alpha-glucosidase n=2 Tax=Granulicella sibirica TaxID=2479048 RepID=A0A4Q0T6N8_9BACT|nr:Alpha-glucosidase [Granulicella sibirica]